MLYSVSAVGHYTLLALEAIHFNVLASFSGAVLSLSLIAALSSQMGLIGAVAGNAGYLITLVLLPLGLKRLRAVPQRTDATAHKLQHKAADITDDSLERWEGTQRYLPGRGQSRYWL